MSLLISDRDGVLFDTCRANIESYSCAAEKLKIKTNISILEKAVHEGRAFLDFCFEVWSDLTEGQSQILRIEKAAAFEMRSDLTRVNHDLVSNVIEKEKTPFLVTRASLASTLHLLNEYQLTHFGERVVSVSSSEKKSEIFKKLSIELGVKPQSILIVDDSKEVILESEALGFKTVLYPHFCNY
jgi:HAD superfamily hydrolase (TIGR01509 family)